MQAITKSKPSWGYAAGSPDKVRHEVFGACCFGQLTQPAKGSLFKTK
jgi:hypothetical protein